MSRSYDLQLKNKDKKLSLFEEFITNELFISGSNMTANEIFVWEFNKEAHTFKEWEVENFLKSAKLNLQKQYSFIKKDLGVTFMADLQWVDKDNFKRLQKAIQDLVENDLMSMMNNIIIELNWILKANKDWEEKLIKILLLLDILNSDDLLNTANSYKENETYKYIKDNIWAEFLQKNESELLKIKDKMTDLMAKMDILQELFSSYESKYIDKDYILSSFVSNYDDILVTLKIVVFCEISKLFDLDIYYNG